MLKRMNGNMILIERAGGCALLVCTVFTKNYLAKLVNVISMCISINDSSSKKAEIGHVVSLDGQF